MGVLCGPNLATDPHNLPDKKTSVDDPRAAIWSLYWEESEQVVFHPSSDIMAVPLHYQHSIRYMLDLNGLYICSRVALPSDVS